MINIIHDYCNSYNLRLQLTFKHFYTHILTEVSCSKEEDTTIYIMISTKLHNHTYTLLRDGNIIIGENVIIIIIHR